MRYIVGSKSGRVKPQNIKLVFAASLLSMHLYEEGANIGWVGIRIVYPSAATCLPLDGLLFQ